MADRISNRGHLACDLKWWHAAMRGIIVFPMMQQASLLMSRGIPLRYTFASVGKIILLEHSLIDISYQIYMLVRQFK